MVRKRVPLGNYVTEYSVRNKGDEDIPVYSVTNSQGFCTDYFDKEVASKDKKTYKIVPKGYFAYNPSRINVGSVDWQKYEERVIVSPLYNVFSVSENLEQQYLFYFLRSDIGKQMIKSKVSGSVRDNLKIDMLKEMTIPERSVEEQKECIHILDTLKIIISLRKKELDKLDALIKARFVESFGNPVLNNKGWEQKILGDITLKIGSGATPKGGKRVYKENGIAFIRSMNVHSGYFEYRDLAYISDEQAHRLDNVTVEEYDVLLNITGASVARCCMIPSDILPARVNQHVCIIRCKQDILSYFLNYLLMENNFQELLLRIAETGATREAITKQQIENLNIIVPPIQLQNEFATFVKQVNKSKFPTLHNHKSIYTKSQLCCKMVIVPDFRRFSQNLVL